MRRQDPRSHWGGYKFAIEATAFEAFDRGYRVIVLRDCGAAISDEEHEHSIKYVLSHLSTVTTSDQFIQWLDG